MAYRLRYSASLDWVGPGMGPMGGALAPIAGQQTGGAQTLRLFNQTGGQNITGTGTAGALAAADITTLTNAMATDIAAQLNLAGNLATAGGWVTGGP